ncbi:hypothetical protein CAOG_003944 [Capsaspora owczarzaki ATCC 30864]|uniref:Uncharacterized protein n=1 Tax=Capsaspora owczarzaki (strain ATCC 30864) TaxID=595528 RepID=A0A0D2UDL1_CAPO3|nr:hypothetical protein CAOG_003944 [Capsaspora owczarzaki ATCC 30864]
MQAHRPAVRFRRPAARPASASASASASTPAASSSSSPSALIQARWPIQPLRRTCEQHYSSSSSSSSFAAAEFTAPSNPSRQQPNPPPPPPPPPLRKRARVAAARDALPPGVAAPLLDDADVSSDDEYDYAGSLRPFRVFGKLADDLKSAKSSAASSSKPGSRGAVAAAQNQDTAAANAEKQDQDKDKAKEDQSSQDHNATDDAAAANLTKPVVAQQLLDPADKAFMEALLSAPQSLNSEFHASAVPYSRAMSFPAPLHREGVRSRALAVILRGDARNVLQPLIYPPTDKPTATGAKLRRVLPFETIINLIAAVHEHELLTTDSPAVCLPSLQTLLRTDDEQDLVPTLRGITTSLPQLRQTGIETLQNWQRLMMMCNPACPLQPMADHFDWPKHLTELSSLEKARQRILADNAWNLAIDHHERVRLAFWEKATAALLSSPYVDAKLDEHLRILSVNLHTRKVEDRMRPIYAARHALQHALQQADLARDPPSAENEPVAEPVAEPVNEHVHERIVMAVEEDSDSDAWEDEDEDGAEAADDDEDDDAWEDDDVDGDEEEVLAAPHAPTRGRYSGLSTSYDSSLRAPRIDATSSFDPDNLAAGFAPAFNKPLHPRFLTKWPQSKAHLDPVFQLLGPLLLQTQTAALLSEHDRNDHNVTTLVLMGVLGANACPPRTFISLVHQAAQDIHGQSVFDRHLNRFVQAQVFLEERFVRNTLIPPALNGIRKSAMQNPLRYVDEQPSGSAPVTAYGGHDQVACSVATGFLTGIAGLEQQEVILVLGFDRITPLFVFPNAEIEFPSPNNSVDVKNHEQFLHEAIDRASAAPAPLPPRPLSMPSIHTPKLLTQICNPRSLMGPTGPVRPAMEPVPSVPGYFDEWTLADLTNGQLDQAFGVCFKAGYIALGFDAGVVILLRPTTRHRLSYGVVANLQLEQLEMVNAIDLVPISDTSLTLYLALNARCICITTIQLGEPPVHRYIHGFAGRVNHVAVSPNGQHLAVCCDSLDGYLLDMANLPTRVSSRDQLTTPRAVKERRADRIDSCMYQAWSKSSKYLALSSDTHNCAMVWNAETRTLVELGEATGPVLALAFSPLDDNILAYAEKQSVVHLLNVETGAHQLISLFGHSITGLAFTSRADLCISTASDLIVYRRHTIPTLAELCMQRVREHSRQQGLSRHQLESLWADLQLIPTDVHDNLVAAGPALFKPYPLATRVELPRVWWA